MKSIYSICFLLFCLIIQSCDKVKGPYIEKKETPIDTSVCPAPVFPAVTAHSKRILIEDFTGHKCGNCPRAHETLASLKQIYGDRIISYAVHVGYFAQPETAGNKYLYDFRSTTGNEIDGVYQADAAGLPQGMINRIKVNGSTLISHDNWSSVVQQMTNLPVDIDMQMMNYFDDVDYSMCTHVKTTFLSGYNKSLKLVLFIVEDSIKNWQKDYQANPSDIPNYWHRHVLRSSLNSTWGDVLVNSPVVKDSAIVKSFHYHLNSNWNANRCSIVAYIYDDVTKEVLQVVEEKVKQHLMN